MVFRWFRRKARRDRAIADAEEAAGSKGLADPAATPDASPAPPRESAGAANEDPSIDVARHRFIAFRGCFPPPKNPGLSFYGGAPIGPPGMVWPRGDADGLPLTFVMQWDFSALAAEDATGLLPTDGALYFFSNLGWGRAYAFCFVHMSGDGQDWATLVVPDDLPPIFGEASGSRSQLASPHIPAERRDSPRLLPRWPFVPVGIDYTKSMEGDEANGEGKRFWTEGDELREALLRAQDPLATPLDPGFPTRPFERPFPAFPHDWAAVRVVAAKALDALAWKSIDWKRFMPRADNAAIEELKTTLQQEALGLYDEAVAYPAGAAVARDRVDTIWGRIEQFKPIFWLSFDGVVDEAVNLSLGLGSEGGAAIPSERVEACARRHRLATLTIRNEYEHEFRRDRGLNLPHKEVTALFERAKAAGELKRVRDTFAPPPNRMFGPPRYVQGDVAELVDEWLLLLELSDASELGLPMGDGVLQFLIRPDDLRAQRFDRVEVICTGY